MFNCVHAFKTIFYPISYVFIVGYLRYTYANDLILPSNLEARGYFFVYNIKFHLFSMIMDTL